MPNLIEPILSDLASALRVGTGLAEVSVGASPSSVASPRAWLEADGLSWFAADDQPGLSWARLRVRLTLRTSGPDAAQVRAQLDELAAAATQAVLADPFRSGLCRHLPIGRATELMQADPQPSVRTPNGELTLSLRCHFELPENPS